MNKAVIFFDIDGTIVRPDNTIPASAVQAIHAAIDAGHICVVNTGRPSAHIAESVRALPFSGYICSCGQEIIYHGQVLKRLTLTPQQSQYIIQLARDCRVDLYIEGQKGLWLDFYCHPIPDKVGWELEKFRKRGLDVDMDVTAPDFVFDKCCGWIQPDSDMDRFLAGASSLFSPIFCGYYVEMVRCGCSKQTGMQELLSFLGIDRSATYAIGDSNNDIPMLQAAAHSAVIGRAHAEACQAAEFISTSLEEDGLANALRHFRLID